MAMRDHHHAGEGQANQRNTAPGQLHTEFKKDSPPLLGKGHVLDFYAIKEMISLGGFGQIFSGYDIRTQEPVAIKVESNNALVTLLRNEGTCLQHLHQTYSCNGENVDKAPFLKFLAYGNTEIVRFLVMEQCGKNLRELKRETSKDQFSMATSLYIMQEMITALRYMHNAGWIHRDVKPANFCVGLEDVRRIYLIDFGMCRYYLQTDGSLKPRQSHASFHGTVRYVSLNVHDRQDISRWDDLWSLFYVTVEHMCGQLPWRMVNDRDKVAQMKRAFSPETLKYGEDNHMPHAIAFLKYYLDSAASDPVNYFYYAPPYSIFLAETTNELSCRGYACNTLLDWQRTVSDEQSDNSPMSDYVANHFRQSPADEATAKQAYQKICDKRRQVQNSCSVYYI
ncbi:hypothetical protein WR25_23413 [Diploscapter pachys]|uniref:Protein kinase domain-containing protein n=1 Tax=Diploscapter pachys TaxID=2018661 RepID=A0A2A2JM09_9BILA|nr:hypothetical protein WR25_23413 [Diploscapter pachys]